MEKTLRLCRATATVSIILGTAAPHQCPHPAKPPSTSVALFVKLRFSNLVPYVAILNTFHVKMFSHFTLVLESELSSMLQTCIRAAWLLDLSIKKNQPKPIIRTEVTVLNVQKCVMVATLTLYHLEIYTFMSYKMKKKSKLIFWTVWLVFSCWVTYE